METAVVNEPQSKTFKNQSETLGKSKNFFCLTAPHSTHFLLRPCLRPDAVCDQISVVRRPVKPTLPSLFRLRPPFPLDHNKLET